MHNPCAVIPVYNHETAVPDVVQALLAAGLPCVLVDDASSPACSAVLEQLAQGPGIHLIRLAINQGKGGAVLAGLREAERLGFSHVLQVDADGQHDLRDVATFIQVSQLNPEALICGYPQYDTSVVPNFVSGACAPAKAQVILNGPGPVTPPPPPPPPPPPSTH